MAMGESEAVIRGRTDNIMIQDTKKNNHQQNATQKIEQH